MPPTGHRLPRKNRLRRLTRPGYHHLRRYHRDQPEQRGRTPPGLTRHPL